ncbi:MAG: hypothetical protein C6W59_06415 [Paenibacillaceae bacterium]|nr:MAG: hypothetical protein C6W59_06415 [Paenibacillaceae bacterium]
MDEGAAGLFRFNSPRMGGSLTMKRRLLLTAVISMMAGFSLSLTAAGDALLQAVRAYLNKEIGIVLNGGPWDMNVAGEKLYPLTYEGRTYLPVRAVAEALSVPIVYDAAGKKIYIGEKTDKVPIITETYRPVSARIVSDASQRLIDGTDHGTVALFEKVIYSNSYIQLEPDAKYSKLVLYVDVDGDDVDLRIVNRNDPMGTVILQSVVVTEADGLKEIEVDITGIRTLSVDVMTTEPNKSATVRIAADKSYYQ